MRGKASCTKYSIADSGITPAYAGKSTLHFYRSEITKGSPPPMRGKVRTVQLVHKLPRITPAYAGKRLMRTDAIKTDEDHPRLCGEKHKEMSLEIGEQGSPPPMRGKV